MTDRELMQQALVEPPTNQCGETCERAKLCATCASALNEQPVQQPLTDEQIDEAQDAAEESFHAMNKGLKPRPLSERASYFDWHLARAIEAAHGIGEKK